MKNDLIIEVSFITLLSSSNHSEDLETVVEISTLGSKQVEQHIGYFHKIGGNMLNVVSKPVKKFLKL